MTQRLIAGPSSLGTAEIMKMLLKENDLWSEEVSKRDQIKHFWIALTMQQRLELITVSKLDILKRIKESRHEFCSCHGCGLRMDQFEALYWSFCSSDVDYPIDDADDMYEDIDNLDGDDDERVALNGNLAIFADFVSVADEFIAHIDSQVFLDSMEVLANTKLGNIHEADDYDEDDDPNETILDNLDHLERLFQVFAAKIFQTRLAAACDEKSYKDRQAKLLEELEMEEAANARQEKAAVSVKAQKKAKRDAELKKAKTEKELKLKRDAEAKKKKELQKEAEAQEKLKAEKLAKEIAEAESKKKELDIAKKKEKAKSKALPEPKVLKETPVKAKKENDRKKSKGSADILTKEPKLDENSVSTTESKLKIDKKSKNKPKNDGSPRIENVEAASKKDKSKQEMPPRIDHSKPKLPTEVDNLKNSSKTVNSQRDIPGFSPTLASHNFNNDVSIASQVPQSMKIIREPRENLKSQFTNPDKIKNQERRPSEVETSFGSPRLTEKRWPEDSGTLDHPIKMKSNARVPFQPPGNFEQLRHTIPPSAEPQTHNFGYQSPLDSPQMQAQQRPNMPSPHMRNSIGPQNYHQMAYAQFQQYNTQIPYVPPPASNHSTDVMHSPMARNAAGSHRPFHEVGHNVTQYPIQPALHSPYGSEYHRMPQRVEPKMFQAPSVGYQNGPPGLASAHHTLSHQNAKMGSMNMPYQPIVTPPQNGLFMPNTEPYQNGLPDLEQLWQSTKQNLAVGKKSSIGAQKPNLASIWDDSAPSKEALQPWGSIFQ